MQHHWNQIIEYLSEKEKVIGTYDLAILAGNSLPYLADELIRLYQKGQVKSMMLVGGIGHATPFLRRNLTNLGMDVSDTNETEMYLEYIQAKYGLTQEMFFTETQSKHSGENALFSLDTLASVGVIPKNVVLLEDPILQRRIKATFEKEWHQTETVFINHVPKIPFIKEINSEIIFEDSQLNGLWNKNYFFSLVLGEIPRLRNDLAGYGPKGAGYIGEVDIPNEIEKAYRALIAEYDYSYER